MAKRSSKTFHFSFEGMDDYVAYLERYGNGATGMSKRALYDGVAVVGESIREAIEALPYHPTKGVSHAQKEGLLQGLGYSFMKRKKGSWFLKIGFDGYNSVHTKAHPNGQPNAMIAAAVNSGTSRRKRTNFLNKAVNKAKPEALEAMRKRFEEDIKNMNRKR